MDGSGTPLWATAKVFKNYHHISTTFASDKRTVRWVYYILSTKILKLENSFFIKYPH